MMAAEDSSVSIIIEAAKSIFGFNANVLLWVRDCHTLKVFK
jgi:hypothetical protein